MMRAPGRCAQEEREAVGFAQKNFPPARKRGNPPFVHGSQGGQKGMCLRPLARREEKKARSKRLVSRKIRARSARKNGKGNTRRVGAAGKEEREDGRLTVL